MRIVRTSGRRGIEVFGLAPFLHDAALPNRSIEMPIVRLVIDGRHFAWNPNDDESAPLGRSDNDAVRVAAHRR